MEWWSQVRSQIHTYSDFTKLFLDHFNEKRLKKMTLRRLQGIKYNNSEHNLLVGSVYALTSVHRDLWHDNGEADLLEILFESLPLTMRSYNAVVDNTSGV